MGTSWFWSMNAQPMAEQMMNKHEHAISKGPVISNDIDNAVHFLNAGHLPNNRRLGG